MRMGGYDGNVVLSKDYVRKSENFKMKLNGNGKAGSVEFLSNDESRLYKHYLKEGLSRRQNNQPSEESRHLSSIAQTYLPSSNIEFHSNTSITESKKRSSNSFDDSVLEKLKEHTNPDMYAKTNMSGSIPDGCFIQKQENSGSSGKRRRDSCDTEEGSEGPRDKGNDSFYKKRKVGRGCDDVLLKMLGPLKLPDYVKSLNFDYDSNPEILKLNRQLVEINEKLRCVGTVDDLPEDEKPPSPPPIYNEVGIRLNTRKNRLQAKLCQRKQQIICELNHKIPLFWHPTKDKPTKFTRKLYIPVKQYPGYNFVGLLIGPRGLTQKRMEKESGARILLRGKGSARLGKVKLHKDSKTDLYEDEDLHVYIEAANEKSLETASQMVEKLLVPVKEEVNLHKHEQLRELTELNSKSDALINTLQMNSGCLVQYDARTFPSVFPLTSSASGSAEGIGNNSTPSAQVWLPRCSTNPASSALSSIDTKSGEVVNNVNLFVGFLPKSVNTERLIELFSPFGCICEAAVIMDKGTGLSKGYGFVKFTDSLAAAEALAQMNGLKVDGKTLAVRLANRPPLTVNTIIGPRGGLRFSSFSDNPVSTAIHARTPGKWVAKESCGSTCCGNSFPSYTDSLYRRRHAV